MQALRRHPLLTSSLTIATTAAAAYHLTSSRRQQPSAPAPKPNPGLSTTMAAATATATALHPSLLTLPPFTTTFAVPMHCSSCTSSITSAVLSLPLIQSASCDLPSQTLTVRGTAAPSAILAAVQETGRDAVLRGSGEGDNNAAVAILETYDEDLGRGVKDGGKKPSPVRGLVRLVEVADGVCIVDVSVGGGIGGTGVLATGEVVGAVGQAGAKDAKEQANGEKPQTNGAGPEQQQQQQQRQWRITLRQAGDLSRGPASTGGIYTGADFGLPPIAGADGSSSVERGAVGHVGVSAAGKGAAVLVHPISVWEVIGRGVVVEDEATGEKVAGVVARSAGVWGNDKTVCSCSGMTVWEERAEQRGRGML